MTEKISKRDLTAKPGGRGLVQVFTGDGKGKTTAALGAIVRALGHNLRVAVIFFMKGDYPYGERKTLAVMPGVTVKSFGSEDFVFPKKVRAEQKDQVAEEVTREEESGPGFRAGELGIPIPMHDRAHLAHQKVGEQRARQHNGEEVHQASIVRL